MRKSLLLACAFACVSIPAFAADAVSIEWGNAVAAIFTALDQLAPVAGVAVLWLIGRILGAPAQATAKAFGVDRIVSNAVSAAVARVPGAVAGKTLELDNLNPVVSEAITIVQAVAPNLIKQLGGMDAATHWIVAEMSKQGLVPPEATAAHFSS